MKTEKLILSILLTSSLILKAQERQGSAALEIISGYGNFQMEDLKRINDVTAKSLPFDVVQVNDFKHGPFFAIGLKYSISKSFYTSFGYHRYSTGSRIGQKDYSGYFVYDQLVTGQLAYIEPGLSINAGSVIISPGIPIGIMFSTLDMEQILNVGESKNHDNLKVFAHSLVFIPSVKIMVPVTSFLGLNCGFGGMIDNTGKFHLKNNKDAVLNVNGVVKTGWYGLMLSAGITLRRPVKNTTVKKYNNPEFFDNDFEK